MTIHYEPHPVSAERKAELRAEGLTIVDAIYRDTAPASEFDAGLTRESISNMPRKEVIANLEAHGIEGATGKVKDLRDQLEAVVFI